MSLPDIQGLGDMLKVLVMPCDIQLPVASRLFRWKAHVFCKDLHASDSFHSTRPDSVVLQ